MSANAAHPTAASPQSPSAGFPPGIPYIVGNEGAERFSFYGMRQILYVYLTALFVQFAASGAVPAEAATEAKIRATQWTHLFMAGVYLFPMIGAILADRLLGKYRVIFWVSLVYCAGHGVLALAGRAGSTGQFSLAEAGMLLGLALIAIGSGGIKPCVSANVGDQFTSANAHLVTRVFQIFYFIINFGSFFATLLTPWLFKEYGAEVAFGVPGILMALAAFIFWLGRDRFVKVPPQPGGRLGLMDFASASLLLAPLLAFIFVATESSSGIVAAVETSGWSGLGEQLRLLLQQFWWLAAASAAALVCGILLGQARQKIQADGGFFSILAYCWKERKRRTLGASFWEPARARFGEEAAEGPPAVLRIILVFSMVSIFWALFDQHSSTWVEQAKAMNLTLRVPAILWDGFVYWAIIAGSIYGAVWLFLWISNRAMPRICHQAAGAALLLWAAVAVVLQQTLGSPWKTIEMLPAQIAALNPLFVMIIIPLLNVLVYRPAERRGRPLAPLARMAIGMFLAAASFVAVALIQRRVEALGTGEVHVVWQVLPFFIITVAEVMVSVTGLEFAYTQAPRSMKSTIMGLWLLGVTFGNVLVAFLAPLQRLSLETFFWLFAGLMGLAACIFLALAATYRGKTYLQA